jgi:hypothetical protein
VALLNVEVTKYGLQDLSLVLISPSWNRTGALEATKARSLTCAIESSSLRSASEIRSSRARREEASSSALWR